jgi:membrane-bound ClpP family serine protease
VPTGPIYERRGRCGIGRVRTNRKPGFGKMKNSQGRVLTTFLMLSAGSAACIADTFVHNQTKERLHGYATTQTKDGKTVVQTQEKGAVELNLAEWQISPDRLGRNNEVIVLRLDNKIMLQMETEALMDAIDRASDKGPLFILLEIDTPGGRVDYTRRICGVITQTNHCPIVAFINGGKYGGAISAGAAVAFACDEVYMANNTVIGASAPVALSGTGPKDPKETYGEEVGEKITSVWRTYLASLAEQNHRPALLAGAMVDKDLEVIEVWEADERLFIDPANKTPGQELVHMWSKKGSLLTLTAEEAVQCNIADKVVDSRAELLRHLKADKAKVVTDNSLQEAQKQFRRAKLRVNKLSKSIDLNIKQMQKTQTTVRTLKLLREIRTDYRTLITLAKRYPDLQINSQVLERQLNTAEALYQEAKMRR